MQGMEKQRRCRIDWSEHLPEHVVRHQVAYERTMTALRMREVGLKYREIGEWFGVGVQRARQLVAKGERIRKKGRRSPAEELFTESTDCREFLISKPHQYSNRFLRQHATKALTVVEALGKAISSPSA